MNKEENFSIYGDFYRKLLNVPHRRLIVDDSFRLVATPPQKKLYTSCGCLLLKCFYSSRFTCNKCCFSYNIMEL